MACWAGVVTGETVVANRPRGLLSRRVFEQLRAGVVDEGGSNVGGRVFMGAESGYTLGMKTAVSVPNEVFERAERLAKRLNVSRSELYSRALREYLARHAPDEVTAALNVVCDELDTSAEEFVREAGRRVLESSDW